MTNSVQQGYNHSSEWCIEPRDDAWRYTLNRTHVLFPNTRNSLQYTAQGIGGAVCFCWFFLLPFFFKWQSMASWQPEKFVKETPTVQFQYLPGMKYLVWSKQAKIWNHILGKCPKGVNTRLLQTHFWAQVFPQNIFSVAGRGLGTEWEEIWNLRIAEKNKHALTQERHTS